jgi:hypothetical protein
LETTMTVLNGIVDIMGTKVDPPVPRCSPNLNPLPDPNLIAAREALKRPLPLHTLPAALPGLLDLALTQTLTPMAPFAPQT